jgi:hypothetical protein
MPLYQRSDRDCLYRKLTHTFYSSSLSRSQAPCCMPVFRRVVVVESVAFLLQGLNHPATVPSRQVALPKHRCGCVRYGGSL